MSLLQLFKKIRI